MAQCRRASTLIKNQKKTNKELFRNNVEEESYESGESNLIPTFL